jgi:hypothetical protein
MTATSTAGGGASAVSTASGGGTVYSGFGGAAATTTASGDGKTSSATAVFLTLGHSYGILVVAAGIFAGFSLL